MRPIYIAGEIRDDRLRDIDRIFQEPIAGGIDCGKGVVGHALRFRISERIQRVDRAEGRATPAGVRRLGRILPTPFSRPGRCNREKMPGPVITEQSPIRSVTADDQAVIVPERPEIPTSSKLCRTIYDRPAAIPGNNNPCRDGAGARRERQAA